MAGDRPGAPNGFEFFAGVSGESDTGLAVARTDASGQLISPGLVRALRANFGIQGVHRGRRSSYGLAYIGSVVKSDSDFMAGSEHALAFTTENRLSRRVTWSTDSRAGAMTRPYGMYYGYAGLDQTGDLSGIANQPLNSRFYFLQHQQNLAYRLTAHTEFEAGGSVFKVAREGNLYSAVGYGGNGALAHQFSSRTVLALQYQFLHYEYGRAYGGSDVQVAMVELQRRLNARWNLSAGVGGLRTVLDSEQLVTPDPVVVALFGNQPFIETFHQTKYSPALKVALNGRFARSSVTVTVSREATPGNGIMRTSLNEGVTTNYSYTGIRRWTFGLSGGYMRLIALEQSLGKNNTGTAGGSVSYYLGRSLSFTARADYRKYVISQTGAFRNDGTHVSVALMYHSRERPLNLW